MISSVSSLPWLIGTSFLLFVSQKAGFQLWLRLAELLFTTLDVYVSTTHWTGVCLYSIEQIECVGNSDCISSQKQPGAFSVPVGWAWGIETLPPQRHLNASKPIMQWRSRRLVSGKCAGVVGLGSHSPMQWCVKQPLTWHLLPSLPPLFPHHPLPTSLLPVLVPGKSR